MDDELTEAEQWAQEYGLFVAMDHFGGDWTPIAVLTDPGEAVGLKRMLEADAEAAVEPALYYGSCENVQEGMAASQVGVDEVTVAFTEDGDVLGAGSGDDVARALCIRNGHGLRAPYRVYETAAAVADDKPSVVGKFISSELTAEDIMEEIQ